MNCLLLIDIQNDFLEGGALEIKKSNTILPVANKMISIFRENNYFICATKDWHPITHKSFASNHHNKKIGDFISLNGISQILWPNHCIQNTYGSEFPSTLYKIDDIIYKGTNIEIDSYSGFFDNNKLYPTLLHQKLQNNKIKTLYIMGLATDYCVKYTVIDALELGYEVFLILDGCKGVDIDINDSEKAIDEMKSLGAKIIFSTDINFK